jgi:hypothetical protein
MKADPTLTPQANLIIMEHQDAKRRDRRRTFLGALGIAGVLIMVLGTTYAIPAGEAEQANGRADGAEHTSYTLAEAGNSSADKSLELCLAGDETARKMEAAGLCEAAKRLKQAIIAAAPTPTAGAQGQQGKIGETGAAGRGIVATNIVGGRFKITYSDGATEDKGIVKGDPGATGEPGRGITGTTLANGHLTLLFSDGTTQDVGQVVGKDGQVGATGATGATGAEGKPGRGISGMTQLNGHLMVTYTDGTTSDLGPLPPGPPGNSGEPPISWTQHWSDGSSSTCSRAANFDYAQPQYDCPPPSGGAGGGLLGGG